jgi:type II secretory pathway pseudopilin PulG
MTVVATQMKVCLPFARAGWSLVELLTVIVVIGLLGANALNAIQSARESARSLHCQNNLRQVGLATAMFEGTRGHYPTGGWGRNWVADSGTHPRYGQPGGWIYQLLPYLEASAIHDLPNVAGERADVERKIHELLKTPCFVFHCPTRGNKKVVHFNPVQTLRVTNLEQLPTSVALTDYAANAGVKIVLGEGPTGRSTVEIESNSWMLLSNREGMVAQQNRIRTAEVTAGISNVLWVGEKHVGLSNYDVDRIGGNDQSMYSGECSDIIRFSGGGIQPDWLDAGEITMVDGNTMEQVPNMQSPFGFGTPHLMYMNAVLLDGSVQKMDVNMDRLVFWRMSFRRPPKW